MSSNKALSGLDPLKDLLGDVITRLEVLEGKVGVTTSGLGVSSAHKSSVPVKPRLVGMSLQKTKHRQYRLLSKC